MNYLKNTDWDYIAALNEWLEWYRSIPVYPNRHDASIILPKLRECYKMLSLCNTYLARDLRTLAYEKISAEYKRKRVLSANTVSYREDDAHSRKPSWEESGHYARVSNKDADEQFAKWAGVYSEVFSLSKSLERDLACINGDIRRIESEMQRIGAEEQSWKTLEDEIYELKQIIKNGKINDQAGVV